MQKRRRSFGIRGWLIATAILLVVLLLSARGLARIYTDYLWFQEVHFSKTWRGLIEAKAFPALIFSLIFFVAMYVDLIVADRLAPMARSAGPEDEIVERYRNVVQPYAGRIRFAVAAFFAVVMASGFSQTMCRPAFKHCMASFAWVLCGVMMASRFTSDFFSMSATEV